MRGRGCRTKGVPAQARAHDIWYNYATRLKAALEKHETERNEHCTGRSPMGRRRKRQGNRFSNRRGGCGRPLPGRFKRGSHRGGRRQEVCSAPRAERCSARRQELRDRQRRRHGSLRPHEGAGAGRELGVRAQGALPHIRARPHGHAVAPRARPRPGVRSRRREEDRHDRPGDRPGVCGEGRALRDARGRHTAARLP